MEPDALVEKMTMWYDFKEAEIALSLSPLLSSHNQILSLHGLLPKILPLEFHPFSLGFDFY